MSDEITTPEPAQPNMVQTPDGLWITQEEFFWKEQLRMMREARLREQFEIAESLKPNEQE